MARIRNIDDSDELAPGNAADLERIGRAPTATAVVRVRDILLIPPATPTATGWPPLRSRRQSISAATSLLVDTDVPVRY